MILLRTLTLCLAVGLGGAACGADTSGDYAGAVESGFLDAPDDYSDYYTVEEEVEEQTVDMDCSDFSTQAEAQEYYEVQVGDPDGLDADSDGLACEALDSEYDTPSYDAAGVDMDCSDFGSQQEAQDYYMAQEGDPDGLDRDQDGEACEALD